jgi:hypothetical protein
MALKDQVRSLTVAEARAVIKEKAKLIMSIAVALIAAILSFIALTWVAAHIPGSPPWSAPLWPLMIDGFGIICAISIAGSQSLKEPWRERSNEWIGLTYALTISVAGNLCHVAGVAPRWMLFALASAPPVLIAYSVHLYGRSAHASLSAHMLKGDDKNIHFDLRQIGDERSPKAPRERSVTAQSVLTERSDERSVSATVSATDQVHERWIALGGQASAKVIADQVKPAESTVRRIIADNREEWSRELVEQPVLHSVNTGE